MNLEALPQYPVVCIDTETTGLEWTKHKVFGVAISVPACSLEELIADPINAPIESIYFDVRKEGAKYRLLKKIAPDLRRVVNHHMKFDVHMLANDGVLINTKEAECTMIRACLINEHLLQYSLDALGAKYLGIRKVEDIYEKLAALFGGLATRKAQMPNLFRAPPSLVAPYAVRDTELALRLWAWQEGEIRRQDLGDVWSLERRLFSYIVRMERRGIPVDPDEAEKRADMLTTKIDVAQKELNKLAGFEVNPNPSASITKLFEPREVEGRWYANDGTPLGKTPAGKPSLGAEALELMQNPAAKMVLRLRKMIKTRDTFIRGHILGHMHNGRVHPNINQTKGDDGGTGTGRLSYTGPALQQIPSRDKETAALVRPIFVPEVGHGWTYGDLDQHELRIFHHYVNNPKVVQSYQEDPNLDGHQIVADLTGLPRNAPKSGGANAKQMNLAMVFNMGGGTLAAKMGLPFTWDSFEDGKGQVHEYMKAGPEAQAIIDTYYGMVPGVKEIASKARTIAKSRGYVKTIKGRHIRFPGGNFTHKASGLVYQGSAADLNKENIMRLTDYLDSECPEAALLLNIHDEYSISIPRGADWRKICRDMRAEIQNRPELRIPIRIDFSELGDNWWDATTRPIVK